MAARAGWLLWCPVWSFIQYLCGSDFLNPFFPPSLLPSVLPSFLRLFFVNWATCVWSLDESSDHCRVCVEWMSKLFLWMWLLKWQYTQMYRSRCRDVIAVARSTWSSFIYIVRTAATGKGTTVKMRMMKFFLLFWTLKCKINFLSLTIFN